MPAHGPVEPPRPSHTIRTCSTWSSSATASPPGTPRTCSPAGSTSTSRRAGRSRGPRRRAAPGRRARARPADPPHLGAHPGHPHGRAGPGRAGRSWLPVRRHWRLNERHYGALQGKNKAETVAEFGDEQLQALAPQLRHPAAAARPRRPDLGPADDPRYRDLAPGGHPDHRVPGRRGRAGCSPTGRTPSCPTCARPPRRAVPCWWPPTATASGPCASTWRASPTPTSSGSRSPPASRSAICLDDDLSVHSADLPGRPRGRRGGRGCRRPPGGLSRGTDGQPVWRAMTAAGRSASPRSDPADPLTGRRPRVLRCAPAPRSRPG